MPIEQMPIKTDHILGHKLSIDKFKTIKTMQIVLFNQNGIKLEISNRMGTKILQTIGI
jgi:hypothetical protein